MKSFEFKLLFQISVWKDLETKDDRCTVAILLPRGIGENVGDFIPTIVEAAVLQLPIEQVPKSLESHKGNYRSCSSIAEMSKLLYIIFLVKILEPGR